MMQEDSLRRDKNDEVDSLRNRVSELEKIVEDYRQASHTVKRRAEKQFKLLSRSIERSPISVVITDRSGKIEYVNPSFTATTGYTPDELTGKNLRILKSGYHPDEFYTNMWNTILSGKEWSGEFRNKRKNGELYWEKTSISSILDNKGQITHFVAIQEDITERKKMVEDLVAAKEKAEESDRLKLAFLANISHEIRTPMNGILGFAEILKDSTLTSREHEDFIRIIQDSGKRMLDTVNDLIDISKIETGQVKIYLSEIDVNVHIRNLYNFFKPQAEQKGLKLILKEEMPCDFAIIKTDHSKFDSIFSNLIKNAIKFTSKGKIEIGCRPKGKILEFYVSDTGIGVAADWHEAIFNRFEQVDEKTFQGSGLGLPISKSYVQMLGGKISLRSKPGQGSTFCFTLPWQKADVTTRPAEKKTYADSIPHLGGKKILVCEDDFYSGEMLHFLLEKTGASLFFAKDGMETLKLFRTENFDLVLLDIGLPEMDGYEVLREIRSDSPDALVIAQTAYAMTEDIKKFNEAGFNDYLTKPISQHELYTKLERYLN